MLLLSSINVSKYSFRKNQPKLDFFETRAWFYLMTVGGSEHREGVRNYRVLHCWPRTELTKPASLCVCVCVCDSGLGNVTFEKTSLSWAFNRDSSALSDVARIADSQVTEWISNWLSMQIHRSKLTQMGVFSLAKSSALACSTHFINDLNGAIKGLLITFANRDKADIWNVRIKLGLTKLTTKVPSNSDSLQDYLNNLIGLLLF